MLSLFDVTLFKNYIKWFFIRVNNYIPALKKTWLRKNTNSRPQQVLVWRRSSMPTEKKELKKLVKTWKGKKGTLIMILHEIQNQYGYIPEDVSLKLANLLDIPLARIYEVITFYHYFKLNPPGKYKINVCMGTACYLKGAPDLIDELRDLLNIDEGETTKDGLFQLESVRCLGCCGLAPVMTINDKVYGNVKKQDLHDILATYTKEEKK